MKFSKHEILDLTTENGGSFSTYKLDEAYKFCQVLVNRNYENFPVGSIVIPKNKRKHFFPIYVFSRIADDIADENHGWNKEEKINFLSKLLNLIDESYLGNNPLFLALNNTCFELNIPKYTFEKLIKAFIMDINFEQPNSLNDILIYCDHSANPIGEFVLRISDEYNPETKLYSDKICTALQLANFWQDFSRDLDNGRNYIPKEILKKNELENLFLEIELKSIKLSCLLQDLLKMTDNMFDEGLLILNHVKSFRLKLELLTIILAGKLVLKKIEKKKTNIFNERIELFKTDFIKIFIIAFLKLLSKWKQ